MRILPEVTISIGPSGWDSEQCDENGVQEEDPSISGWFATKQTVDGNRVQFATRDTRRPPIRLRVAHLTPISIRPKSKTPQIVNVCQTFRFPDNYITQNNATRLAQRQEQHVHQQRDESGSGFERRQTQQQLNTQYKVNRCLSGLGGFFGVNRYRQRSMHSQTSRTLLELVEAEQSAQQAQQQQQQQGRPAALPRTLFQGSLPPRMAEGIGLVTSGSESTISDRKGRVNVQMRQHARLENPRPSQVPYFGGKHPLLAGNGKQPKQMPVKGKLDHRKPLYEDPQESPFVGDPLISISGRGRKQHQVGKQSLDDLEFDDDSGNSDVDELDEQDLESDACMDRDEERHDLDDESEVEPIGDSCGLLRRDNRAGGKMTGSKDSVGISGIVDKLQDNVWEVCLEGIWDLMDMAGRIDWKAQEKYITVINRKLIEFLKSPRTALCRSACQVSGELFREAKSTKRPEFDEIVDILLCKTADPNRFIQKDANVALDKLVTYIPTPHTVRALSNRGTMKFGERLYRMLRKHKFFDEYFYKDMDNNLRTNLKRVLKGI
uniref:CLASP N-terminal domain-containing protein n=1 Tax=Anopheles atroparvus TaxID=41427 RepID=A0A182JMV2_ANOAO